MDKWTDMDGRTDLDLIGLGLCDNVYVLRYLKIDPFKKLQFKF